MLGVGVPLGTPGKVIFVFTAGTETTKRLLGPIREIC